MTDSTLLRDVLVPEAGPADLLLRDGRVAAVTPAGTGEAGAAEVVEGGGRWALPGFVDAHVHGEAAVFDPDVQLAMLRQGITTVVLGQDGVSVAPSPVGGPHDATAYATSYFAAINGAHPGFTGGSVADVLATYDGATAVNVAYLAPHGTLRFAVVGGDLRPATGAEVEAMAALLAQAVADGACGLSTGLEYLPGGAAERDELVALCRVVAGAGLPHVSHMRGYEAAVPAALAELVDIARSSGVATHVSHLHGPADVVEAALADAAAAGVDVTFDSYPYLRGCTILSMLTLPGWVPVAEPERALALLASPRRAEVLEHLAGLTDLWPRTTLASVPGPLAWAEGLTLPEVAARLGLPVPETVLELLVRSGLRVSAVFAQPPTNSGASVRRLLEHPGHLAGSDAIYLGGRPHPRGWGAFARIFALGVHELGGWSIDDVVAHLSGRAAALFRLPGRGRLSPGAVADVVLADPAAVRDRSAYADPRRPAEGIDDVWVGGVAALRDGRETGATPGRAVRPGPA
ncbi:amidohydrolase family protein [Pseudonocardia sp. MH-G8]|uniref:N-acyl-D-amino-acid deacylase family protein n=1 Tax=Pseudonocardia sp. MH-G8 TaxID=1854588 RepID=UPI000BA12F1A|nr:amidohydrolase family protein [Pseudonocardia sp. MH-G8]OZM79120.1 N-acyl-D-aspartate/D-glutamate deacylase [Pseudonocardia sp. MH-G8]